MPIYGAHGMALLKDHLESGKPLEQIQLIGIDLSGMDFSGRSFKELSVSKSLLDGADFTDAAIEESIFEESNMKDVLFVGSRLQDTDVSSSILLRAMMQEVRAFSCSFKRSYMQRLHIRKSMFCDCLFINIEAEKADAIESVFSSCDFRFDDSGGVTGFQESVFQNCIFMDCTFEGFALTGVDMTGSVFIRCRFRVPDWEDVETAGGHFFGCSGIPGWKELSEPPALPLNHENAAKELLQTLGSVQ